MLYLSALSVALSQLKVIMIFPDIIGAMSIQPDQVSWLMSVFTVAGVVLAIPGAAILGKLGPKKLLLCLVAAVITGNLLGAAAASYSVLLISRMIEGIAFAMVIMVGIVFISQWFAGGNVGFAIGLYTTFPALGSAICMNVTAPIAASLGFRSVWFIVATIAAISFVLILLYIKSPKTAISAATAAAGDNGSIREVMANKGVWLLALCQGCVAFILFTFITVYPQLFMENYHLDQATAGFYAGLNGLFGIPFCIVAGIIIDKFKNAPLLVVISFIGLAVACFITTMLSSTTYVLHTLLTAMFCGLVIPGVLYIAPGMAKRPALIGYTVALVNLVYFIAIFAGVPVVMSAVAKSGWQSGANILVGVAILGALTMLVFMATNKRRRRVS